MNRLVPLLVLAVASAWPRLVRAQTEDLPELCHDFRASWRLGAPGFAFEEFPAPQRREPLLFPGRMKPRGMLVLRAVGDLEATPPERRRVLRSTEVDITPNLSLLSAHHEATDGELRFVEAGQLPSLRVQYETEMPARIEVPSRPGTCVLLFEIGEGLENEWAPGLWTLKLRFDAGPLNLRLAGAGLNGVPDPSRPAGTAVIYELSFFSKRAETSDDELNFALFQFQDARATGDTAVALSALDRMLAAYPNDGNVRFARAKLLFDSDRKAEALADARQVLQLATDGQLRRPFNPPGEVQLNRPEAIEWLRIEIAFWEAP